MSFENQGLGGAGKGFESGAGGIVTTGGGGGVGGIVRDEASCIVQESSGDSGSTLKAHDYIGLSEVTSMPVKHDSTKVLPDLNLGETELRLGPPKRFPAPGSEQPKNHPAPVESPSKWGDHKPDNKNPEQEVQNNVFWQARMIQDPVVPAQAPPPPLSPSPMAEMNTGYSNVIKKRVFSEAIGSNGFVEGRNPPPQAPAAGGQSPVVVGGSPSPVNGMNPKNPLMPSSMYPWGNKQMPAAWRMGLDQSKGSFGPFPTTSRINHSVKEASADNNNNNIKSNNNNGNNNSSNSPNSSGLTSNAKEDAQEDVAPSTSPPVVGWPPVQSFRKNTLASHPGSQAKPGAEAGNKKSPGATAAVVNAPAAPAPAAATPASSSPLFVKVYMDGVPIGRKVDLKANNSYDKLSAVLEDMFHRFITGQNGASEASSSRDAAMSSEKKLNFLQSSDFVLTYEDKDGDLMLVGDVPWGMFTGTVKRLRIMKGSEAIGLAPRAAAGDKA